MKRRNATRSALFTSIISLLLCVSMLVGTTFAWFTDSVVSGNNVIAAGNLDVELYHTNNYVTTAEKVEGLTDLFTVEEGKAFLWEPGAVLWENFTVANEGSLALKYQLAMNFTNATETAQGSGKTLADVLKVAVIAGGFNGTREDAKALAYNYSLKSFALEGKLEAGAASDVYGIVIYWQPGANDNDYNVAGGLSIDLGIKLFATQLAAETDSFDNTYDVDAWEDTKGQRVEVDSTAANVNTDGSASLEVNAAPSTLTNKTVIDAPAGTFAPTDKVEVKVEAVNGAHEVSAAGNTVAALDITLYVNGKETSVDLEDGKLFTVTTYISKGLDLNNVSVAYVGDVNKAQPTLKEYDPVSGKLVFTTSHFSLYTTTASGFAYDAKTDTVLTTVQQIIAANQNQNSEIVIPEANQQAIKTEIEKLPEDQQQAAAAATAAAKIGDKTYATLAEAFAEAKDNAPIVVLNNVPVKAAITIPAGKNVVVDLNGKTVSGILSGTGNQDLFLVKGNLTMKDGSVELTATQNQGWGAMSAIFDITGGGVVNLENVVADNKGGTDMNFVAHLNNWGEASLNVNNSTLKATYVAVRVFNSGYDMNNVSIKNSTLSTTGNAAFWVHNYTVADFGTQEKADAQAELLNFTFENVKFEAKKAAFRYGFTNAEYYTADGAQVVGTADELVAALEAKKDVIFANDITMKAENSNGYGVTGIVVDGQTINGNGYTLKVTGASATWDSAIYIKSGSVENITVAGAMRGIFTSDAANGDIYLNNVIFSGVIYTFNSDGTSGKREGRVYITNCRMNGWTSFSDTHTEVIFTDCTFGEGSGYAFCRPYNVAKFVNCDFEEGFEIDPRAKITFENCTINGIDLTAENLATLVTSNIDNASVK